MHFFLTNQSRNAASVLKKFMRLSFDRVAHHARTFTYPTNPEVLMSGLIHTQQPLEIFSLLQLAVRLHSFVLNLGKLVQTSFGFGLLFNVIDHIAATVKRHAYEEGLVKLVIGQLSRVEMHWRGVAVFSKQCHDQDGLRKESA